MKYEIQIEHPQTYMQRIHAAIDAGQYVLALGMMDDLEHWVTRHVDADSITVWKQRIQRTEHIVRKNLEEIMSVQVADNE